ncbi:MAG TPA: hypothetical protein VMD30_11820 [Tepidisphaeraceae bacterium]|nr:hypothetical protein [Tepidisphaeraceae bacterium]
MSRQFNENDKRALDVLLDVMQHSSAKSGKPVPVPGGSSERMQAARKLMSLLDMWELPEPPPDLAARTLARCEAEERSRIDPNAELSDSHFGQSLT